jgi:type I restriction enzyme S subunit
MSEARAKIVEPDESDDPALPSGWVETTLDEIGVWSGGGTPSKRDDAFWTGGTIPWVSPKDMKSFAISDSQDRITHQAVEKSAAKLIPGNCSPP